jgi:hypothetical protein
LVDQEAEALLSPAFIPASANAGGGSALRCDAGQPKVAADEVAGAPRSGRTPRYRARERPFGMCGSPWTQISRTRAFQIASRCLRRQIYSLDGTSALRKDGASTCGFGERLRRQNGARDSPRIEGSGAILLACVAPVGNPAFTPWNRTPACQPSGLRGPESGDLSNAVIFLLTALSHRFKNWLNLPVTPLNEVSETPPIEQFGWREGCRPELAGPLREGA